VGQELLGIDWLENARGLSRGVGNAFLSQIPGSCVTAPFKNGGGGANGNGIVIGGGNFGAGDGIRYAVCWIRCGVGVWTDGDPTVIMLIGVIEFAAREGTDCVNLLIATIYTSHASSSSLTTALIPAPVIRNSTAPLNTHTTRPRPRRKHDLYPTFPSLQYLPASLALVCFAFGVDGRFDQYYPICYLDRPDQAQTRRFQVFGERVIALAGEPALLVVEGHYFYPPSGCWRGLDYDAA
jgi:hypothetical protein